MEPAEDRPDDRESSDRSPLDRCAAMEPAEDRPDDKPAPPAPEKKRRPQWSRPRIGRMTAGECVGLLPVDGPQWSRPRIGRMTPCPGHLVPADVRAAMEPAEDRPDDPART